MHWLPAEVEERFVDRWAEKKEVDTESSTFSKVVEVVTMCLTLDKYEFVCVWGCEFAYVSGTGRNTDISVTIYKIW